MVPHWSSVLFVLLPITWIVIVSEVAGLSCKFCQSVNNYSSCIASVGEVQCTDALVNMTRLLLQPHNPSLARTSPPMGQYECFQVNFTTAGVWNYHMGCTSAGSNICAGWKVLSQCRVTDERGQSGKVAGITPSPAGKVPTPTDKLLGSSSAVLSVASTTVRSTNGSFVLSTVTPKLTDMPTTAGKHSSKAAIFSSSKLEMLLMLWIVVCMRNYC